MFLGVDQVGDLSAGGVTRKEFAHHGNIHHLGLKQGENDENGGDFSGEIEF